MHWSDEERYTQHHVVVIAQVREHQTDHLNVPRSVLPCGMEFKLFPSHIARICNNKINEILLQSQVGKGTNQTLNIMLQVRVICSHSSVGHTVRLITERSTVRARAHPPMISRRNGLKPDRRGSLERHVWLVPVLFCIPSDYIVR
mgnify:CR=1 FL=1